MEDLKQKKRWSVTYTKHIKQKRKVYQDGFLDHHVSTNKVKLFDECDNLLECKILKGDEVVSSGETLTFNGCLVDVGDLEGEVDFDHKVVRKPNINLHSVDKKIDEISKPDLIRRKKFRSPSISSSDKKVDLEQRNTLVKNISPSKKMIREFKKSEMQRYGAFQSCPDRGNPTVTEWQVMYTTKMTQKAKKYHDGFLRLTNSGYSGRQIMLYDERRELLDSRFLKKDEMIRSHESITFAAHLVDIGEPEGESQFPGDLNIQGSAGNIVGKKRMEHEHQNYLEANRSMAKEWHALYTSRITQKAKKYQSGILRLASSGSYRMQVTLLNEDKTIVSSKFLSLSEDVRSGSTFMLPKYLVEVGEPHSSQGFDLSCSIDLTSSETSKSACSSKDAGSNFNIANIGQFQNRAHSREDADSSSIYTVDRTKIAMPNKSLRDIHQILSILQKPIVQESVVGEGTDKNMATLVSSAKGLHVSETKVDNRKDSQLPKVSLSDEGPRVSLQNDGPNEHKDDEGSSASADNENHTDLFPSKETSTVRGGQVSYDQSHLGNENADVELHDGGFAFGFSTLASDKKERTGQLKSAKEIDEWPTFDLGF